MVPLVQLDMTAVDGGETTPSDDKKKISTPATDAPRRTDTSWFSKFGWIPIMCSVGRNGERIKSQNEKRSAVEGNLVCLLNSESGVS
jgi:hypothetical protein